MLETLVFDILDFFNSKIKESGIPPISDDLGITFTIENSIRDMRSLLSRIDESSDFVWYACTWLMTIEPFSSKSSLVREADTDSARGFVYKVVPVNLNISGSVVSNDPVALFQIYEHIFLISDDNYPLLITVDIENRPVQVNANVRIIPEDTIQGFDNVSMTLASFRYNLKVTTELVKLVDSGKLIKVIDQQIIEEANNG